MQLAFCLYKYFPYGGLQRDFLRIAQRCVQRGHAVRVYALEWEGERPDTLDIVIVPVNSLLNHRQYAKFTRWVQADLAKRPVDRVVGFNKMPGLDVYYAADPCFEHKARTLRGPLYRFSPRYRHFATYERAVFAPGANTELLMISHTQQELFKHYYDTPAERFHLLPPGIASDRRAPDNADEIRQAFRNEFGIKNHERLLLQIASDPRNKGLDRTLAAMHALPDQVREYTRLFVVGIERKRLDGMLQQYHLDRQVQCFSARDDIPHFLLGADLLIHPARHENTGTVLLEALVAGLPVIASGTCGYAHYIEEAEAGCVVPEPFSQDKMNQLLHHMLSDNTRRRLWHTNALAYADVADLYSMPDRAADVILQDHATSHS